jgi:hypothetical protein
MAAIVASYLVFSTPGCWEVKAQVGHRMDSRITFVTRVEVSLCQYAGYQLGTRFKSLGGLRGYCLRLGSEFLNALMNQGNFSEVFVNHSFVLFRKKFSVIPPTFQFCGVHVGQDSRR